MGAQHQAAAAGQLRIRMYRVGFGDFFLVSVPSGGGYAHILIDCGVHAKDLGVIDDAVAQLKEDTGGKLALVIMTHRHADHISGFGSQRDVFKTFTVERVWMSWFENRKDKAAMRIQAGIAATAVRLQAALSARGEDNQHFRMAGNALGLAAKGNQAALEMLHGFKGPDGKPTPVDYYAAGEAAKLPPSLAKAGLEATILGPPRDLALVAKMDNAAHQYLSQGQAGPDEKPRAPFHPAYRVLVENYRWPEKKPRLFDDGVVRDHIAGSQPDSLALAAQKADNALNNQSLVVLFGFNGKTMLFAGDAQWGNWANFLFGGQIGTKGHTELRKEAADMLADLDFYKVGHHGSRNATPKDFVAALKTGCVAMCSTEPHAYNEVPRKPLIDALLKKTGQKLARSDQVAVPGHAVKKDLPPLPQPFQADSKGFIDYFP